MALELYGHLVGVGYAEMAVSGEAEERGLEGGFGFGFGFGERDGREMRGGEVEGCSHGCLWCMKLRLG